ncbi:hypothetical protein FIV42_10355 [Persicimonas caeni]|uniref:Uncharacterized protein n=1 Tax=Persicimonas caeni TaxID=2292766 RepID=A0A4Y6PS31_PERCE|nr:hypothetical protein [Persicimonas caeni]QDG51121.1 hypothetical protein FIV42_10355 [Persicimonas caeni]QED32342.1 hypothetical protein FRD00_10350 [Persicimonas caeni]
MSHRFPMNVWERFARDERGTALTEFIIVLPIFVIIFAGIGHLTRLNKTAIRLGGTAYKQMWEKAKKVQTDDPGVHVVPAGAASMMQNNMATYTGLQEEAGMKQIVQHETSNHAAGLLQSGHMGESYNRVRRARQNIEIRYIDAELTSQLSGVTGESAYAQRLFDDSGSASTFYPGSSSAVSSHGLRPVIAAGTRYGTVVGSDNGSVDVGGREIELAHYFTTLVAPKPSSEEAASAVARSAMWGNGPYDNLLGIATDQPLQSESLDVPTIEGAFGGGSP